MPRPLMFVPEPWQAFELTIRCHQSRLLMCSGDECSRRVLGVLGRALELYGDHVHLYFAGVDPQVYIADVLVRIAGGWPMARLDELLPHRWRELLGGTAAA